MRKTVTRRGLFGLLGAVAAVAAVPVAAPALAAPERVPDVTPPGNFMGGSLTKGTLTVSGNVVANQVLVSSGSGVSTWGHVHPITVSGADVSKVWVEGYQLAVRKGEIRWDASQRDDAEWKA